MHMQAIGQYLHMIRLWNAKGIGVKKALHAH